MFYGYYIGHNNKWKEGESIMVQYNPLWKTMSDKKVTTYTLRVKYGMGHATVQRLQRNMPVSTHTLDRLCKILSCRLEDIAEYIPDDEQGAV